MLSMLMHGILLLAIRNSPLTLTLVLFIAGRQIFDVLYLKAFLMRWAETGCLLVARQMSVENVMKP